ncbi:MAG: helix-turn-helix transcriptional regulator [Clostridia bacterium]|nr:helix-turn-helix transcriptional regulator [Clostridia bacterium]
MTFAEKSKYLRKEKKLSQVQLAQALNISKACISMIEIGKNEPTANTLIRYADFFECSTDYLLDREDDLGVISIKKENPAPALSLDEIELIKDYRALEPALQEMLRATIQTWKQTKANKKKLKNNA